jgi:DNA polymerase (family 10)
MDTNCPGIERWIKENEIDLVANKPRSFTLDKALKIAVEFKRVIKSFGFKCEIAGSVRRRKETVGDVDLVVIAKREQLYDKLLSFSLKNQKALWADSKNRKFSIISQKELVEIYYCEPKEFPYVLLYRTGNLFFNLMCEAVADRYGLRLTERALYGKETDERIFLNTEDEVLDFISPGLDKYKNPLFRGL